MEKFTKFLPKFGIGDNIKYKGFRYEIVDIVVGEKFYSYTVQCVESKFVVEDYFDEIVTSIGMKSESDMELVEKGKTKTETVQDTGKWDNIRILAAMFAMGGIIANGQFLMSERNVSEIAVAYADELIEELKK